MRLTSRNINGSVFVLVLGGFGARTIVEEMDPNLEPEPLMER